jgi:hypothetical protein
MGTIALRWLKIGFNTEFAEMRGSVVRSIGVVHREVITGERLNTPAGTGRTRAVASKLRAASSLLSNAGPSIVGRLHERFDTFAHNAV